MPRKKTYTKKKTYVKRKQAPKRKAKYTRNRAVTTTMHGQGFSDMVYVKLAYADRISIAPGTAVSNYVFRGNSLFDPDQTATGHQPLYFDQYSLIYSKYRVMGSSLRIDIINASGASGLYYVVEPNTEISTATNISQAYEQGRAGAPKFVPIAQRVSSRYKRYASTRKVCGLVKAQLFDDTFAAATSANPANQWYWNILFESADASTVVAAEMVIKMTYYVQFYDKINTAQS